MSVGGEFYCTLFFFTHCNFLNRQLHSFYSESVLGERFSFSFIHRAQATKRNVNVNVGLL